MKYALITIFLLSLLLSAVAEAASGDLNRRVETLKKMDGIKRAMDAYALSYGRVPCPADSSLEITNENLGKELLNEANCSSDAGYADENIVAGGVPVRALSLPDSFMFDGWGRRMLYVVDQNFAASGAFQQELDEADIIDQTSYHFSMDGELELRDTIGGDLLYSESRIIGLLLSYGQNGYGAFTLRGSRMDSGRDLDELENSHYQGGGTFNNIFIKKRPTDSFDDVTRIIRRNKNIPLYCLGVDVPSRMGGNTPEGDGYPALGWPSTPEEDMAELDCSTEYTGTVTRDCVNGGNWGGIVSTCNCNLAVLTDGSTYSGTWPVGDDVGTVIGDTYTLTEADDNVCLPGFAGNVTAECQSSGGWVVITNNCGGE